MHIRCTNCRHAFNLSRDYIVQALEESSDTKLKYHAVECINCRKMIKVPLKQLRRYAPIKVEEPEESEQ